MFTSLLPGREKGYYAGGPGVAESGYGNGGLYGQQQYGVQPGSQPNGPINGGSPNGYAGNGGVSQPPPAYGSR